MKGSKEILSGKDREDTPTGTVRPRPSTYPKYPLTPVHLLLSVPEGQTQDHPPVPYRTRSTPSPSSVRSGPTPGGPDLVPVGDLFVSVRPLLRDPCVPKRREEDDPSYPQRNRLVYCHSSVISCLISFPTPPVSLREHLIKEHL